MAVAFGWLAVAADGGGTENRGVGDEEGRPGVLFSEARGKQGQTRDETFRWALCHPDRHLTASDHPSDLRLAIQREISLRFPSDSPQIVLLCWPSSPHARAPRFADSVHPATANNHPPSSSKDDLPAPLFPCHLRCISHRVSLTRCMRRSASKRATAVFGTSGAQGVESPTPANAILRWNEEPRQHALAHARYLVN